MARDPNFFVYSIQDAEKVISRSTNSETTLVLLNSKLDSSRIENLIQPDSTKLQFYRGIPDYDYNDTQSERAAQSLIFANPIKSWSSGNTYFFNTIEPMQYSLRALYIRVISFQISHEWKDPSYYKTTAPTTTGFLMSREVSTPSSNVDFMFNSGHNGIVGLLVSTALFADANATFSNNLEPDTLRLHPDPAIISRVFEWYSNATNLYVTPSQGVYYIQYFRADLNEPTTTSTAYAAPSSTASTSTPAPTNLPTTTGAPTNSTTNPPTATSPKTSSQPVSSSTSSTSSPAPTNPPTTSRPTTASQSTASQNVETTTKLGLTASITVSIMTTLLHKILFA